MKKTEKWMTIIGVVAGAVGAMTGIWGAYTAYDASRFKQPFDEHAEISKSFVSQIDSAEKRSDEKEATRVRIQYELYEEKWRAAREIAQIVRPVENLASVRFNEEELLKLKGLVEKVAHGPSQPALSPETLGAAYFAMGDFKNAAAQFNHLGQDSGKPNTSALKAAAFSELALEQHDPVIKDRYEEIAKKSYLEAVENSSEPEVLSDFATDNPKLKAVLENDGILPINNGT
jgi:hypothetical protein